MIRLAIDVMGGDHGVGPLVQGAISALEKYPQLNLILVGDAGQIGACLSTSNFQNRFEVVDAPITVDMQDNPIKSLRNKADASMAVAIDMVSESSVDGAVSAGNTGALVAFGVKKLGMLEGISRPAICTQVPSMSGKTWLLDLGATLDSTEDRFVELALLGAKQCTAYDGKAMPKVGLLNVGEEVIKGTPELQRASLRMAEESCYDYEGYVEGDSIFSDDLDVVVCDGFSGNVAIKTAQGVAQLIVAKVARFGGAGLFSKLLLSIAAPALKRMGRQLNPALYNGAPLLGLRGIVVKSHGNASAQGFMNAISVAIGTVDQAAKAD